jgi:hypothetical protein
MGYCTECGALLDPAKKFCTQCGREITGSGPSSTNPPAPAQPANGQARIHRISGSTKYLINGTLPLQGKKFETLEEIRHFYDHHEEVLAATTESLARQQDAIILGLGNDEVRLDRELQEAIARTTVEVDAAIHELDLNSKQDPGILIRAGYRVWYWIAVALRNYNINSPNSGLARELNGVRNRKRQQMIAKDSLIQQESYNITCSYVFLKKNETFLVGADGEEYVIIVLSQLPAGYHVINDVNLHFHKAIRWREYNEYIRNCQIDHVVVGPTGIFLLETKNWKASDIREKSGDLRRQILRSKTALWYYLKDRYHRGEELNIRPVVVSIKGSAGGYKPDKYIDVVPPRDLCRTITTSKSALSDEAIEKLVRVIVRMR